jgi:hypothetical protein
MPDFPTGAYSPLTTRPSPKLSSDTTKKPIPFRAPAEQFYPVPVVPVERLLRTRQVAVIMAVSVDTVKKWRQRPGKGPRFIRYGDGSIRYRLSTVMRYLDEHEVIN